MGLCKSFFGTYIEIEIDDVMIMIHEFGIFESCFRMTELTLVKKKIAQNALIAFFLSI